MLALRCATAFRRLTVILSLTMLLGGGAGSAVADEADEQYAVAAGHYAVERWSLAAEEFQAFLDQFPQDRRAAEATFLLAEARMQLGKYDQAGAGFRRYLAEQPNGRFAREALYRAGESAYLAGDYEQAKAELERFLKAYPEDEAGATVLPYLGDVALGEGDANAAAGYFRAALDQFPAGPLVSQSRYGLARALERRKQNEEALKLYKAVAARADDPLADDAQFHLGALQYATGEYRRAIETFAAFDEAFRDSRWRPEARLGTGWALQKLERFDEAARLFEELTADPQVGTEARYWLGMVRKAQGNYAAAARELLRAADDDPNHELITAIRYHAADALRETGRFDEARRQFDALLDPAGESEEWADDALHGKIQVALAEGNHAEVDRLAAQFGERFPDSPLAGDAQRMRAQSHLKRKQYAEGRALLEPLVAGGRGGEQALADRYLLAQAYQGQKSYDQALAVLLPVIDAAEGQLAADAQLTRGTILLAMNRFADAIGSLEAFLESNPTGDSLVKARAELAICYARAGQLDEAKALFERLTAEHGDHELVGPLTEQLAEAAYAAGDNQWSEALFQRLKEQTARQEQWKGLSGVGWSQFRAGRLAEAAATFEELLDKQPPAAVAAEAALARGRILEQMQPAEQALPMYDLVIEKYSESPKHPEALLAAARLRHRLTQDREAAALYERLAREYPQHEQRDMILYEWAWVADALSDPDLAEDLFARVYREYRDGRYWADAGYRLARRAFGRNDYDRAGKLVGELLATELPPEIRESTLNLRGRVAAAEEDWKTAAGAFEKLLTEYPDTRHRLLAEYWLGDITYRQGERDEAARRFERLQERIDGLDRRESWMAMVPLRRAQLFAQSRDWKEALRVASEIERRYPNFPLQYEADYVIGLSLATRADFEGARAAYERVIRSAHGAKTETAAMAEWMIGETYFHQKNYAAALRRYLRLRMRYDFPRWQALALLQAGKCREKLGEPAEAAKHYAELIETFPDSSTATQARELLEALPPEANRGVTGEPLTAGKSAKRTE